MVLIFNHVSVCNIILQGPLFLVKWDGYNKQDCTWEPESHIPANVIQDFLTPPVGVARLRTASEIFECAILKRLSSKQTHISVNFDLDIFRHVFETDKSVLLSAESDLEKLNLCPNWFYKA